MNPFFEAAGIICLLYLSMKVVVQVFWHWIPLVMYNVGNVCKTFTPSNLFMSPLDERFLPPWGIGVKVNVVGMAGCRRSTRRRENTRWHEASRGRFIVNKGTADIFYTEKASNLHIKVTVRLGPSPAKYHAGCVRVSVSRWRRRLGCFCCFLFTYKCVLFHDVSNTLAERMQADVTSRRRWHRSCWKFWTSEGDGCRRTLMQLCQKCKMNTKYLEIQQECGWRNISIFYVPNRISVP